MPRCEGYGRLDVEPVPLDMLAAEAQTMPFLIDDLRPCVKMQPPPVVLPGNDKKTQSTKATKPFPFLGTIPGGVFVEFSFGPSPSRATSTPERVSSSAPSKYECDEESMFVVDSAARLVAGSGGRHGHCSAEAGGNVALMEVSDTNLLLRTCTVS